MTVKMYCELLLRFALCLRCLAYAHYVTIQTLLSFAIDVPGLQETFNQKDQLLRLFRIYVYDQVNVLFHMGANIPELPNGIYHFPLGSRDFTLKCSDFITQFVFSDTPEITDHSLQTTTAKSSACFGTEFFNSTSFLVIRTNCLGDIVWIRVTNIPRINIYLEFVFRRSQTNCLNCVSFAVRAMNNDQTNNLTRSQYIILTLERNIAFRHGASVDGNEMLAKRTFVSRHHSHSPYIGIILQKPFSSKH